MYVFSFTLLQFFHIFFEEFMLTKNSPILDTDQNGSGSKTITILPGLRHTYSDYLKTAHISLVPNSTPGPPLYHPKADLNCYTSRPQMQPNFTPRALKGKYDHGGSLSHKDSFSERQLPRAAHSHSRYDEQPRHNYSSTPVQAVVQDAYPPYYLTQYPQMETPQTGGFTRKRPSPESGFDPYYEPSPKRVEDLNAEPEIGRILLPPLQNVSSAVPREKMHFMNYSQPRVLPNSVSHAASASPASMPYYYNTQYPQYASYSDPNYLTSAPNVPPTSSSAYAPQYQSMYTQPAAYNQTISGQLAHQTTLLPQNHYLQQYPQPIPSQYSAAPAYSTPAQPSQYIYPNSSAALTPTSATSHSSALYPLTAPVSGPMHHAQYNMKGTTSNSSYQYYPAAQSSHTSHMIPSVASSMHQHHHQHQNHHQGSYYGYSPSTSSAHGYPTPYSSVSTTPLSYTPPVYSYADLTSSQQTLSTYHRHPARRNTLLGSKLLNTSLPRLSLEKIDILKSQEPGIGLLSANTGINGSVPAATFASQGPRRKQRKREESESPPISVVSLDLGEQGSKSDSGRSADTMESGSEYENRVPSVIPSRAPWRAVFVAGTRGRKKQFTARGCQAAGASSEVETLLKFFQSYAGKVDQNIIIPDLGSRTSTLPVLPKDCPFRIETEPDDETVLITDLASISDPEIQWSQKDHEKFDALLQDYGRDFFFIASLMNKLTPECIIYYYQHKPRLEYWRNKNATKIRNGEIAEDRARRVQNRRRIE